MLSGVNANNRRVIKIVPLEKFTLVSINICVTKMKTDLDLQIKQNKTKRVIEIMPLSKSAFTVLTNFISLGGTDNVVRGLNMS